MFQNFVLDALVNAGRLLQESEVSIKVGPLVGVLSVLALVLLNGFFVATEFSMVTVRRSRIEQLAGEGHRRAGAVMRSLDHLDMLIAGTQLGITIASLGLGWVGEPAVADLLVPVFELLPLPEAWLGTGVHTVAFIISFSLITALHILLGELVPKAMALQQADNVALFVALPMSLFLTIFGPVVRLLSGIGNVLLRLVGISSSAHEQSVQSIEELRYIVTASRKAGVLEAGESDIAVRAFSLGDLTARRVMVSRTELMTIPADISLDAIYELASHRHHTRFPVYEGDIDHILGILHLTDVVAWERRNPGVPFSARTVVRDALVVPESLEGDRLLAQMRKSRAHTAIVVDEFGGVEGMVTMQDVLERIVGALPERDETHRHVIETRPDGTTVVDGLAPVAELSDRFNLELAEHEAETVGGYVLEIMGRVPQVGDILPLNGYNLRVDEMDGPRVARVVLSK